jgi:hypothetical protein|tara:strand:- start:2756 stop:3184 length:429 start_codon:yes stop_codon:yes gene_type:complete
MQKLNSGGNPHEDAKAAKERFKTIVEPIFLNKNFRRLNKRNQILINDKTKSIVHVTSAPSQRKTYNDFKVKAKKYSLKEYEGYSNYVLFTRDYNEWKDKNTYQSTLKKVMSLPKVNGVATGLGHLTDVLSGIEANDKFYIIK